jgi:hypothetical protein
MRFILFHRTNAHWEAGAAPGPELIARVGGMLGELAEAGVLLAAEGLRASSHGARLDFRDGRRSVTEGPFGGSDLPSVGFVILRVESLEAAIEWASRLAEAAGDAGVEVRPITEPWEIGMAPRPEGLTTTRFMALRKADRAAEAGVLPTPERTAALARLLEAMTQAGVLLAAEGLRPTSEGARLGAAGGKRTVTDGPFTEAKELIAGYVIVRAPSRRAATDMARRYADAVGPAGVDVRALGEPA